MCLVASLSLTKHFTKPGIQNLPNPCLPESPNIYRTHILAKLVINEKVNLRTVQAIVLWWVISRWCMFSGTILFFEQQTVCQWCFILVSKASPPKVQVYKVASFSSLQIELLPSDCLISCFFFHPMFCLSCMLTLITRQLMFTTSADLSKDSWVVVCSNFYVFSSC